MGLRRGLRAFAHLAEVSLIVDLTCLAEIYLRSSLSSMLTASNNLLEFSFYHAQVPSPVKTICMREGSGRFLLEKNTGTPGGSNKENCF